MQRENRTLQQSPESGHDELERSFHRDETGAAYSLSILLILPFYIVFLSIVLELAFLLVAKMGTIHASYAAARSASVHGAVVHPELRLLSPSDLSGFVTIQAQLKAKNAAVQAMVPFAGGFDSASESDSGPYVDAYTQYLEMIDEKQRIGSTSVRKRYASAQKRVSVSLRRAGASSRTSEPWREVVIARVEYDAPFRLPYIGRLLGGTKKDGAVVKTCVAETTLPLEMPQNQSGYLGVPLPGAATDVVSSL